MFDYYPDQLRAVAKLCDLLNEFDRESTDSSIFLKGPIVVADGNDPDVPLGVLVDEIGGSWSFKPAHSDAAAAAGAA